MSRKKSKLLSEVLENSVVDEISDDLELSEALEASEEFETSEVIEILDNVELSEVLVDAYSDLKEELNPKFSSNLSLEELTFGLVSANLLDEGQTVANFRETETEYVVVSWPDGRKFSVRKN